MPDYKVVGAALWSAIHSYQEDDAADVFHLEQSKVHEASLDVSTAASQFEMLPLRELGKCNLSVIWIASNVAHKQ